MPATPADVARYTSDGVVLTARRQSTKDRDPNALDTGDSEIEMFFDSATNAQVLLDERFHFVGHVGREHEAIEIADTIGLGSTVPIFPAAPQATLVDDSRRLNAVTILRAYSFDSAVDRYAMELVGLGKWSGTPVTFDTTKTTFDNGQVTWDNAG